MYYLTYIHKENIFKDFFIGFMLISILIIWKNLIAVLIQFHFRQRINRSIMISDYYNRQFSLERSNTKTIKLKSNQVVIQPFVIPSSHFNPNKQLYEQLKDRCQKIKTQFSFITNQIQRQHRQKKQKQEESKKLSKALFQKQNREQVQRQMTLTCQKLMRIQQFRKSNFQELKFKRVSKTKQIKMGQVVGQPVTFSPKKTAQSTERKRGLTPAMERFRHSLDNQ